MTAMNMPGPFQIVRITEMEGSFRPPEFLFPDATPEEFAACKVAKDPRYYDAGQNLLMMSFHTLVIRTDRNTILVDTCIGNDKERPALPDWHRRSGTFLADLAAAGVPAESIDFVMCTHLHADHVGWNTKLLDGRWVPTFPNAKYIFAKSEAEHWQHVRATSDDAVNHRSWDDSVQPILDAGQAILVDNDYEIEPGIHLMPAPGHTPGNVVLHVSDGKQVAYMVGDTIHHAVQIERPDWSSTFCWDKDISRKTRTKLLGDIADTGALLMPAHFPAPSAVRVLGAASGFDFESVAPDE
jgi:glyoxylase-like metal-dependent hydrolase (beta-lactamase superfamily II)